jgi:hypothetical protein
MTAKEVIGGPHEWPGKYIPIIKVFSKERNVGGKTYSRGMVRNAKAPQQVYNYTRTNNVELISLAPKSPYILTHKMMGPHQAMWESAHAKNWPYLLFEIDPAGPTLMPKREPPPQMSSALVAEIASLEHEINAAAQVHEPSLGENPKDQSGKALALQQQAARQGSYPFKEAMETGLIFEGKQLIDLIPQIYDTDRVERIRGEDDKEVEARINGSLEPEEMEKLQQDKKEDNYAGPVVYKPEVSPYLNDITVGKYDVRVRIAPSWQTQREEGRQGLLEFVQAIPQSGPLGMDLIAKLQDFDGAEEFAKRLKKAIPIDIRGKDPGEEVPEQPPDPKFIIEQGKLMLKEMEERRKSLEAMGKLQQDGMKSFTEAILNIAKAEAAEEGTQIEAYKAIVAGLTPAQGPQQGGREPSAPQGPPGAGGGP